MRQPEEILFFAQKSPVIWLLLIAALGACGPSSNEVSLPPAQLAESSCGENGALQASLFGSIETQVNWSALEMECENMKRPRGEGMRFRFAGDVAGETLSIIIAMPGLKPDQTGVELPTKVTATVEGSGRFFTTPNLDSCWTEIRSQTALSKQDNSHAIDGVLFCIAPLGEVNGDAAVSIPELSFSALVNWSDK